MRKLIVFLLSLALLLSLSSCADSTDAELLHGTYVARNAYLDETEISLKSMFPEGFEISLKKGGKCELHINSGKYSGSWQCIGSSFRAEGAGAVLEGTVGSGELFLKGVLGSGVSVRLVCDDISERVHRLLLSEASTYDYSGCWFCEEYFFSSPSAEGFITPELFTGAVSFCFELTDAGKALAACGSEVYKASWETSDSGFVLSSVNFTLPFELSNRDEVTCESDGYRLLFRRTSERPEVFGSCDILYYSSTLSSFPYIRFSSGEAASMSSFMLSGRYLVDSDTLYGTVHSRQGVPQFASVRLLSSGGVLIPGSPVLIDPDCEASYVTMYDGRLYYVRSSCIDDSVRVVSCLPDGSDNITVYEGLCHYLQAHEGRLWFTGPDDRLLSCLPDGSDLIICDVPSQVYSPYFIDRSRFIYQSGSDGQCLHLYDLSSGDDIRLTYQAGLNPVLSGSDLFYATPVSGERFCHLCRLDLSFVFSRYDEASNRYDPVWNYEEGSLNCSSRFAVVGDSILSYDAEEYPLTLWMTLEDSSWLTRSRVPQYVSEDYTVCFVYDSDSVVSQILVSSRRLNDSAALPRL